MRGIPVKLLRALIAAQVAVVENEDSDLPDFTALNALDAALREAVVLAKKLRKEDT